MKFSATLVLAGLFVSFYSNASAQTFCVDIFQVRITEHDVLSSLPTKMSDEWKEPTLPSNIEWSFFNVVAATGKFEMSSSQGHQVASLFEIGIIKSRKSDFDKLVHVIRLVSTKEVLGIAVRFHDEVIFIPKYVPDAYASSSATYRYDLRFTLSSFFDAYFRDYEDLRYRFKPRAVLDL
jgi:hypothetical protein